MAFLNNAFNHAFNLSRLMRSFLGFQTMGGKWPDVQDVRHIWDGKTMDNLHYRLTFDLGKIFISKSILLKRAY